MPFNERDAGCDLGGRLSAFARTGPGDRRSPLPPKDADYGLPDS